MQIYLLGNSTFVAAKPLGTGLGIMQLTMERFKTKLKFKRSSRSGNWVGFVLYNHKTGKLRGVREESSLPKQVCVVTKELADKIEPNVLYDVELIPMGGEKYGWIVVEATPHEWEATIVSTIVKNAVYRVEALFGGKRILFDPMDGKRDSVRSITGAISALSARKDIANLPQVIQDFHKTANIILTHYENDGNYVPKKFKTTPKVTAQA